MGDPLDTLPVLEHIFQSDRLVQHPVQVFNITDAFRLGEVKEFFLQDLALNPELVRRQGVIERYGGAVFYRLGDGILVQVALRVVNAKYLESALAGNNSCWGTAASTYP